MKKEEIQSHINPPVAPICEVEATQQGFVDRISGVLSTSTNYVYDNGYIYSKNGSGNLGTSLVYNGVFKGSYLSKTTSWAGSTPNPPTNGVSPDIMGGKLRLVFIGHETKNGASVWGNCSHNHTAYRGFNIIANNSGWKYCEYYSSIYNASYSQNFTASLNIDYKFMMDFTETQHRIKIIDLNDNVIFDTGLRNNMTPNSSSRQLPLQTSKWDKDRNGIYGKFYLKKFTYWDGNLLSDFLQ